MCSYEKEELSLLRLFEVKTHINFGEKEIDQLEKTPSSYTGLAASRSNFHRDLVLVFSWTSPWAG